MNREFTRRELYDLVWSRPMRAVAAETGISDVALAKHCKKANIPVPERGYWARKQAGKSTVQIALPPRFPGAADRVGHSPQDHSYGSNWRERFLEIPVPPIPTFEEEISSVEQRARKLVGKLRGQRNFEPAHPLIAKLLVHDDERRREYSRYGSSYYAPKYDSGAERRRLLIINALFLAAARLGCRPSMSTSRYGQEPGSERDLSIGVGTSHITFTIEPIKSRKEEKRERLRLALGSARNQTRDPDGFEDGANGSLEDQLTEIFVQMLIRAENCYRLSLVRHREWIIEQKAEAVAEIERRKQEAERVAREAQERLERERIARLVAQAKSLDRANQIRTYVETVRGRAPDTPIPQTDLDRWSAWALGEADRIDPVKNGTIMRTIEDQFLAPMDESD